MISRRVGAIVIIVEVSIIIIHIPIMIKIVVTKGVSRVVPIVVLWSRV